MATEKQLEALAKAREAQKAKKAPKKETAKAVKAEEPAPVQEAKKEPETIVDLIREDKKIKFYLPGDPLNPQIKTWERSFNGHMICLEVGRTYELPEFIVNFISRRLRIQRISDQSMEQYTNGAGKRLG